MAHGMFQRGAIELVDEAMAAATRHMAFQLAAMDLESMTVNERITAGVRARLEYIAQWRRSWPQAMALGALPIHAPTTAHHLGVLVDEIWFFAGDRSTDLHWYTRRGLLMGVYVATGTVQGHLACATLLFSPMCWVHRVGYADRQFPGSAPHMGVFGSPD